MAQEEHILSYGGGAGLNKSKTGKQKKVPQRGLGVAQLEKIRLDEQRQNEGLSPNFPSPNALYRSSQSFPFQGGGNENWHRLWTGEVEEGLHHHLPSSSVVVNNASSSPVLCSQIEPPSNQILCGCNYQEDDQMVGMKRSYPFSLESPPVPSLPGNFHLSKATSGELELPPFAAQTEPRYKCIRDSPLNSISLPSRTDGERLNGDFLTLAPPMAASPPLNSEEKRASDYLSSQVLHITQDNLESLIQTGPNSTSTAEEPFSFFPGESRNNQSPREEKRETIDLSLKL